jgi:hypothetical protein
LAGEFCRSHSAIIRDAMSGYPDSPVWTLPQRNAADANLAYLTGIGGTEVCDLLQRVLAVRILATRN